MNRDPVIQLVEAGMGLPPKPAVLLYELTRYPGRVLTHEQVAGVVEMNEEWSLQTVASLVKRVRAFIEERGWPIQVESVYGIGYRATFTGPSPLPW